MSHERLPENGRVLYTMPVWPSDVVRSMQFSDFFQAYRGTAFAVQTADGWSWSSSRLERPAFTANFSTRSQLDTIIGESTEDSLARAFLDGQLEIQGNISAALQVTEYVLRHCTGLDGSLLRAVSRASLDWLRALTGQRNTAARRGWRLNACPSDLSPEFFRAWLGSTFGHSCAHFGPEDDELDTAQRRSFDDICEALDLQPGDHFLDLSCGWGGLLMHAAACRGVRAEGIAFSEFQADFASETIARFGLNTRCSVRSDDPAASPLRAASFDKIADIGLFHQVDRTCVRQYLDNLYRTLTPGGLLLMHRLTCSPQAARKGAAYARLEAPQPVELPILASELELAETAGFHVLTVNDLSRDYHQTLHHWIDRLQRSPEFRSGTARRHARAWLVHLLDTATKLSTGSVQLHRILLCRSAYGEEELRLAS